MTLKFVKTVARSAQCINAAVRSTNEVVSSVVMAEPEKRSQLIPSIGSSEKLIAITACGLTKKPRIWVMSTSPSVVTAIVLALGASIMMRIQVSLLPLAADRRLDVAMPMPCGLLAATVLISVAAAALRCAGRMLRGIGALAATT